MVAAKGKFGPIEESARSEHNVVNALRSPHVGGGTSTEGGTTMQRITTTLIITSIVAISGCGKQMPIPESLQQESETLPVTGKKAMAKSFTIGDFQIKDVKRKGKTTASASAGNVASAEKSKQKFSLAVAASGAEISVECQIQDSQASVGFSGKAEHLLDCTIGDWTLSLAGNEGTLSRDGTSFALSAWSSSSLMPRPSGYYVKGDANDVAAITEEQMLMRAGMEGELRTAVAAAAAALLVYSDIPA